MSNELMSDEGGVSVFLVPKSLYLSLVATFDMVIGMIISIIAKHPPHNAFLLSLVVIFTSGGSRGKECPIYHS